jgi:hypothetical protein
MLLLNGRTDSRRGFSDDLQQSHERQAEHAIGVQVRARTSDAQCQQFVGVRQHVPQPRGVQVPTS